MVSLLMIWRLYMKEIIDNYGLYICTGLGALVLIITIIFFATSRTKKKKVVEEDNSSILDVNVDGVVDKDFKYGYEKEDTVIVKPEDLEPKVENNEEPKENVNEEN